MGEGSAARGRELERGEVSEMSPNEAGEPTCQACGVVLMEEPGSHHLGALVSYRPLGGGDEFFFIVCLSCQKQPANLVVEKYQTRVRSGLDLNFH